MQNTDPTTEELLAEIRSLRARIDRLETERDSAPVLPLERAAVSRRTLFGLAGAGVAGAALLGGASPAAAVDGDPLILGEQNQTTTQETSILHDGAGDALQGSTNNTNGSGVRGLNTGGGTGVEGSAQGAGAGVRAVNSGGGVALQVDKTTGGQAAIRISNNGTANSINAIGNGAQTAANINSTTQGTGASVAASNSGSGNGVSATAVSGIGVSATSSTGNAIEGTSTNAYGGLFSGGKAPVLLSPAASGTGAPAGTHATGELYVDSAGDLFYREDGAWVKLNQAGGGSGLVLLPAPQRAYDSRAGAAPNDTGAGPKGKVGPTPRRIDLTFHTSLPATAAAAIINLTLTNTSPSGFMKLYPADVAQPPTSVINWSAANTNIANSTITGTDNLGRVLVAASSGTDFIIDVIGYFS